MAWLWSKIFGKVCKLFPNSETTEQKPERIDSCYDLLPWQRMREKLVTGERPCWFVYCLETNRQIMQWMGRNSPKLKKKCAVQKSLAWRHYSLYYRHRLIGCWYQICCLLSDIVIGEAMPVRRSHIPVLSESHFCDDLFIVCSPSIAAFYFGDYKQNKLMTFP